MTKDELKDEMKNKISMALKDPILQQGFEIICKNLTEQEEKIADIKANCDLAIEGRDIKIKELEKENEELKGIKDVATLIKANNDTVVTLMQLNNKLVSKNQELTKAKEIIREYMRFETMIGTCSFYSEEYEKTKTKAEQFLKEGE